jgi:hypothetical protein
VVYRARRLRLKPVVCERKERWLGPGLCVPSENYASGTRDTSQRWASGSEVRSQRRLEVKSHGWTFNKYLIEWSVDEEVFSSVHMLRSRESAQVKAQGNMWSNGSSARAVLGSSVLYMHGTGVLAETFFL